MDVNRCDWVTSDQLYIDYHDNEWGVPRYDSQDLFAKLMLEGQQAGLSWLTILRRRKTYYQAYANFEPAKIVLFNEHDVARLLQDKGVIRHRLKIKAIINNANCYLQLHNLGINFSDFLWDFVANKVIVNAWDDAAAVPGMTPESKAMSNSLVNYGFKYVGPTICYAFMQAVGMVNDHTRDCDCFCRLI